MSILDRDYTNRNFLINEIILPPKVMEEIHEKSSNKKELTEMLKKYQFLYSENIHNKNVSIIYDKAYQIALREGKRKGYEEFSNYPETLEELTR
jgi:flagellar biosynthesis/type III secretory pathway protein FliH